MIVILYPWELHRQNMITLKDGTEIDRHFPNKCDCVLPESKTCTKCGKETHNHHPNKSPVECLKCEKK